MLYLNWVMLLTFFCASLMEKRAIRIAEGANPTGMPCGEIFSNEQGREEIMISEYFGNFAHAIRPHEPDRTRTRVVGVKSIRAGVFHLRWQARLGAGLIVTAVATMGVASAQDTTLTMQPAITVFDELGEDPTSVALGDVNGDGKPDLATANASSNDVSVLLGDGASGFTATAANQFDVGDAPWSVLIGDVNDDGKPDVITTNLTSDDVSVLLGNGSGGFSPAAGSPVTVGTFPQSVAIGDLDGDGNTDLVTANTGSNNVSVLLGGGAGGFAAAAESPFAVGDSPRSVALGDVNGDGNTDLVTANSGSNDVSVLLGDGSGGFAPAAGSPLSVGSSPMSIALGDVNNDGDADLVTANNFTHNASVLLGDGNGSFVAAAESPFVGVFPVDVVLGDVDNDGNLDLSTANDSGGVTMLVGDGAGAFAAVAGSPFVAGVVPSSVALGDIDTDGNFDLIAVSRINDDVNVLFGDGAGGFAVAAESSLKMGTDPSDVVVADFENDGIPNLAILRSSSGDVPILRSQGNGAFAPFGLVSIPGRSAESFTGEGDLATGDLDADGNVDLVTVNNSSNDVSVMLGDGSGGFVSASGSPFAVGFSPSSVALGDVNADGEVDLIVGASRDVSVLLGEGDGGFVATEESPIELSVDARVVALADVDGDARIDIFTSNGTFDQVTVLLGEGTGGFTVGDSFAVGDFPSSLSIGDLDNDGNVDFVTANGRSNDVSVLLGDGVGGFLAAAGSPFPVGDGPRAVVLGDVNTDGDIDLLTANFFSDDVSILLGDGAGGFAAAAESPFAAAIGPISLALADVDGDGRPDVIVVGDGLGSGDETMTVLTSDVLFIDSASVPTVAE